MNILFLMDPLETVIFQKDTTLVLMVAAHQRGHKVFYLPDGGMTFRDDELFFNVTPVIPQMVREEPFICQEEIILQEDEVDIIFIRSDPPFDQQYLFNTWMLDRLAKRIPVINHPNGLRTANEKIWVTQFSDLIPPTLISRQKQDLLEFIREQKDVIAKPTDGFGGQSVFRIRQEDTNSPVILETMTQRFRREIILQKFLPESDKGDKRILLLDGEPLGALLRVHAAGEHRNNFFSGGKPYPSEVTEADRRIIETLRPQLQRLGLYFVGLDIIGEYLMEVNVTSPTCLQEINRLYHQTLENKIIEFAEELVEG